MVFDACFYLGASKHAIFFLKTPRSFLRYTMVALMLSHSSYLFQQTYIRILGHDFFKIIERTLTQKTRTPPKESKFEWWWGITAFLLPATIQQRDSRNKVDWNALWTGMKQHPSSILIVCWQGDCLTTCWLTLRHLESRTAVTHGWSKEDPNPKCDWSNTVHGLCLV